MSLFRTANAYRWRSPSARARRYCRSVDPKKKWKISKKTSHCLADHNLYEGTEVVGTPTATLVRGTVVVEDNKLVVAPGHGQYIKRANFGSPLHGKGK